MKQKTVFQIDLRDQVATALEEIGCGETALITGDHTQESITAADRIPMGHKIALQDIRKGDDILKYGIVIGRATCDIPKGSWVHIHNIRSLYDERSGHLDVMTGAPKDTKYE